MAELKNINIEFLRPGDNQPRYIFDNNKIQELALSIKRNGIVQPIVVKKKPHENLYEIVAGERRWRAAQYIKLKQVPCIVRELSDEQTAEIAAVENINREDLSPIEEAKAFLNIISKFNYTHDKLAEAIGCSRVKITNSIRLLKLTDEIQELISRKVLSEGHGKVIANLEKDKQNYISTKCIKNNWSVRRLEQHIQSNNKRHQYKDEDIDINNLNIKLSEHLGCPTDIKSKGIKGVISIQYDNLEILGHILDKINFSYD